MPMPGISCMGVSGAGGNSFSLDYLTSGSSGPSTTHTFSSVSFGDANANRLIVVAIHDGDTDSANISSCSIGGVSATLAVGRRATDVGVYLYYAEVPTGTTGDIVVNCSTSDYVGIAVWRVVTQATSKAPIATGSAEVGSGAVSLFCTCPVNGAGIVAVTDDNSGSHTSTNFTERADLSIDTDSFVAGDYTVSATMSCSNSGSNGQDKAIIYASWGP